jgi:hypothetical protein
MNELVFLFHHLGVSTMINQQRIPLAIVMTFAWLIISIQSFASTNENTDVYRVDFPGGTISEYVEMLRETIPGVSIIVLPAAEDVPLPPFEVTSPHVSELINVIERAAMAPRGRSIRARLDTTVYYIQVFRHIAEIRTRVQTFSLADTLVQDQISARDVFQSIEAALELIEDDEHVAKLRFHEPTSLLIARGTETQLATIADTIDQLRVTATFREVTRLWGRPLQPAEDDENRAERGALIEQLMQEVRELRQRLLKLEEQQQ